MTKRINFDLEKALSGEYLVYDIRSTLPLKQVTFFIANTNYPLHAVLYKEESLPIVESYTTSGKVNFSGESVLFLMKKKAKKNPSVGSTDNLSSKIIQEVEAFKNFLFAEEPPIGDISFKVPVAKKVKKSFLLNGNWYLDDPSGKDLEVLQKKGVNVEFPSQFGTLIASSIDGDFALTPLNICSEFIKEFVHIYRKGKHFYYCGCNNND